MLEHDPLQMADCFPHYHVLSGRLALSQYRTQAALEAFGTALRHVRAALRVEPVSFLNIRDHAICWWQLARAHQQAGEIGEAYDAFDVARDEYERLLKIEGVTGRSAGEMVDFLRDFACFTALDNNQIDASLLLRDAIDICRIRLREKSTCPIRLHQLRRARYLLRKVTAPQ